MSSVFGSQRQLHMPRRRALQGVTRQASTYAGVDDWEDDADLQRSNTDTWRWTLNWSEIRPKLFVGTCPRTPADLDRLINEAGVGGFVCLQTDKEMKYQGINYHENYNRCMERGVAWTRVAIEPANEHHQAQMLPDATRIVQGHLNAGRKVYLFGTEGVNRTMLVTVAYLCYLEKVPMEEAIIEAGQLRPQARANTETWLEIHKASMSDESRGMIEMQNYQQISHPWGRNGDMALWFKDFLHLVFDHRKFSGLKAHPYSRQLEDL